MGRKKEYATILKGVAGEKAKDAERIRPIRLLSDKLVGFQNEIIADHTWTASIVTQVGADYQLFGSLVNVFARNKNEITAGATSGDIVVLNQLLHIFTEPFFLPNAQLMYEHSGKLLLTSMLSNYSDCNTIRNGYWKDCMEMLSRFLIRVHLSLVDQQNNQIGTSKQNNEANKAKKVNKASKELEMLLNIIKQFRLTKVVFFHYLRLKMD